MFLTGLTKYYTVAINKRRINSYLHFCVAKREQQTGNMKQHSFQTYFKGQLNKKILLAILKEKGLKCRNVKKVSFFHLPFQRYWEFYSAPPWFTTAFLVGWALATLTSCREPCARPTRKILASLAVKGLFTGSVH